MTLLADWKNVVTNLVENIVEKLPLHWDERKDVFEREVLRRCVHSVVGRPALEGGGGSKQGGARPAYSNPPSLSSPAPVKIYSNFASTDSIAVTTGILTKVSASSVHWGRRHSPPRGGGVHPHLDYPELDYPHLDNPHLDYPHYFLVKILKIGQNFENFENGSKF